MIINILKEVVQMIDHNMILRDINGFFIDSILYSSMFYVFCKKQV